MKNFAKPFIAVSFFYLMLFGCGTKDQNKIEDSGKEQVTEEIDNKDKEIQIEEARKAMIDLMNSYIASVKSLDIDKVIDHYYPSPEFKIIMDGHLSNYDETVTNVKGLLQSMSKVEGEWDTIHVSVLSPDVVTAMATYHETFIDKEGNKTPLKGEVTWTAVKDEGRWRFAYGHGYHEPDNGDE